MTKSVSNQMRGQRRGRVARTTRIQVRGRVWESVSKRVFAPVGWVVRSVVQTRAEVEEYHDQTST